MVFAKSVAEFWKGSKQKSTASSQGFLRVFSHLKYAHYLTGGKYYKD